MTASEAHPLPTPPAGEKAREAPGDRPHGGKPDAGAPDAGGRPKAPPREIGGREGPEPTRYGDWEVNGICSDF
ncbi:DUF1674 domain-containing protein [Thermaurantiacus sp.]